MRVIIVQMFIPGLTSIVTDAFGIAIVAITPVPMLQHMAIAGAFWSFITVIIGLIMTPVLMTYVPVSAKFLAHIEREQKKDELRQGLANKFADWLGPWIIGHGRWWVLGTVAAVMMVSYYYSERIIIGDAQVGSNLLYPSSRYNQDSVRINQNLPLINPLYVVLEGEKVRSLTNLEVMQDMKNFTTLYDAQFRRCRRAEYHQPPYGHAAEIP